MDQNTPQQPNKSPALPSNNNDAPWLKISQNTTPSKADTTKTPSEIKQPTTNQQTKIQTFPPKSAPNLLAKTEPITQKQFVANQPLPNNLPQQDIPNTESKNLNSSEPTLEKSSYTKTWTPNAETINTKPAPPPSLPKPISSNEIKTNQPTPKQPSQVMTWFWRISVAILALLIGATAILLIWPRLLDKVINPEITDTDKQTKNTLSAQPILTPPTNTASQPDTSKIPQPIITSPTTSSTIATSTIDQTMQTKMLGDTAEFFLHNEITYTDPKNSSRSFVIQAIEFTDSRCPENVVCVWAGERGVNLKITDKQTGNQQEIYLGTIRAKNVNAISLIFTLYEIEDGKGGTYAQIKVE